MTSAEKEEVKTEARILAELDHPNIIKLVDDSFIEHGSLHIVTEFVLVFVGVKTGDSGIICLRAHYDHPAPITITHDRIHASIVKICEFR